MTWQIGSFHRDIRSRCTLPTGRRHSLCADIGALHFARAFMRACMLECVRFDRVILGVIHMSRYALNGISILLYTGILRIWSSRSTEYLRLFSFSFRPFLTEMEMSLRANYNLSNHEWQFTPFARDASIFFGNLSQMLKINLCVKLNLS